MKKILFIIMLLAMNLVNAIESISGFIYRDTAPSIGQAIAGAKLTINNIQTDGVSFRLPAVCLNTMDGLPQDQITDNSGHYLFILKPGLDLLCPAAPTKYQIVITPPTGFTFSINTPQTGLANATDCTNNLTATAIDKNTATPDCEISLETAPTIVSNPDYYMSFIIANSNLEILNNHIPLKPIVFSFITTWRTSVVDEKIIIPINPNISGYSYNVDWGDGAIDNSLNTDASHNYSSVGNHTVKITGNFPAIKFIKSTPANAAKLISVDNWGSGIWQTMDGAFVDCINLISTPMDKPNFSMLTSLRSMFEGATKVNPHTSNWDTSKVTNMAFMFKQAPNAMPDTTNWNTNAVTTMFAMFSDTEKANPNTTSWDISNVTNVDDMFFNATLANPNTANWNTSKITNMAGMFYHTTNANPDVHLWDTSSVTDMKSMFGGANKAQPDVSLWDTSSVKNMSFMFNAINADPDVSKWNTAAVTTMEGMFSFSPNAKPITKTSGNIWNTSNVTNMDSMFAGANMANPDMSGWNITSITTMNEMFKNVTLPVLDYEAILVNFASQSPLQPDVFFSGGTSIYCSGPSQTARANLEAAPNNWTINDGGLCQSPPIANNDFESGFFGNPVTVNVIANDTDSDGNINSLTIQIIGTSAIGDSLTVSNEGVWIINSGVITFSPESTFNSNPTSISYTVQDNLGLVSNPASVQISYISNNIIIVPPPVVVIPPFTVNIAPITKPDSITADLGPVNINILANDTDSDGQIAIDSIAINGQNTGASLTVNGEGVWTINSGQLTFTPDASFTGNPTPINYTVKDNNGALSNSASVAITYNQVEPPIDNNIGIAFIDSNNRLQIPSVQTARGFFSAELVFVENPNNPNAPYWRLEKETFLGTAPQKSQTQLNLTDFTLHLNPLQRRNAQGDVISQKDEIFKFYFNDADTGKIYWQQIEDINARTILEAPTKVNKILKQGCLNNNLGMAFINTNQQLIIPEISTETGQTFRAILEKVIDPIHFKHPYWRLKSVTQVITNKQANCSRINLDNLAVEFATIRYEQGNNQVLFIQEQQLQFVFADQETGILYWQAL